MTDATRHSILLPGRNCWKIAQADRAAVLVDAEAYYSALDHAIRQAKRSILIVGWDFDGRISLRPQHDACPTLGDLLRSRVEANPELQVDILVWSVAVLHAPSATSSLLLDQSWEDHPRIRFRLDTQHPIYAAHHQKIVCIDETIGFSGGMDLTVQRWDSCAHDPENAFRKDPDGEPYSPVHDIQMVVEGDAARALADAVRERWLRIGETLEVPASSGIDGWLPSLKPDFIDTPVGIARTLPPWAKFPKAEEIWSLTDDAIRAARTLIYIEAQYLTASRLAKLLAKRLMQEDGPDVVILVTKESRGRMEQFIMGRNRTRFIRRLRRADRFERLRIYYPANNAGDADCPIHIHAKLMIIDDTFLRVGSANLNNRSMGLDTECDLAIEGYDARTREAICSIRERLIGEHLCVEPARVKHAAQAAHSTIRGIEQLNRGSRCLHELPPVSRRGPIRPAFFTWLLDPVRPFEPLWSLRCKTPKAASAPARRMLAAKPKL